METLETILGVIALIALYFFTTKIVLPVTWLIIRKSTKVLMVFPFILLVMTPILILIFGE